MESSSSEYCNKDNEEESLLANVASLRHELKITEWSLQNLGEELSRYVSKITYALQNMTLIYESKMYEVYYYILCFNRIE